MSKSALTVKLNAIELSPTDTVQDKLNGAYVAAQELLDQSERAVITDNDSYASGGDLIKIIRSQKNKFDKFRKDFVTPFNDVVKLINTAFNKGALPEFDKAQKTIETKMLAWKKEEDARLEALAAARAKEIEEQALSAAEESGDDSLLDVGVEASDNIKERGKVGLAYGNYGSTTGTRKVYSTNVVDFDAFVAALPGLIKDRDISLGEIIDFRKSGLNRLAQLMVDAGVKNAPGAEFSEDSKLNIR